MRTIIPTYFYPLCLYIWHISIKLGFHLELNKCCPYRDEPERYGHELRKNIFLFFLFSISIKRTTSESSPRQPWPLVSLSAARLLQRWGGGANCTEDVQTALSVSLTQTPKVQLCCRCQRYGLFCRGLRVKQKLLAHDLCPHYCPLYWKHLLEQHRETPPLVWRERTAGDLRCAPWSSVGSHTAGGKWRERAEPGRDGGK